MNKRYFNSRTIRKILNEAAVLNRFKALFTHIQLGSGEQAPLAAVYTEIEYFNNFESLEKDTRFVNSVLNHILTAKDRDGLIELTSNYFLYVYKKEGILAATEIPNRFNMAFNCRYTPDWSLSLSRYVFEFKREDIIRNNKDFLDSRNFGPVHLGNIDKINRFKKAATRIKDR